MKRAGDTGFTLAELLVAATMLSIVMASVYTAFSGVIRTWRAGESSYTQDEEARVAIEMLARELRSIPDGARHLFEGENDRLRFVTLARSMDPEAGPGARLLQITYRIQGGGGRGRALVREERAVEGALPYPSEGETRPDWGSVRLGRAKRYSVASDVMRISFRYMWVPPVRRDPWSAPAWVPPIVEFENPLGRGLPQGVDLLVEIRDATSDSGRAAYATSFAFRGPTSTLPVELAQRWRQQHGN